MKAQIWFSNDNNPGLKSIEHEWVSCSTFSKWDMIFDAIYGIRCPVNPVRCKVYSCFLDPYTCLTTSAVFVTVLGGGHSGGGRGPKSKFDHCESYCVPVRGCVPRLWRSLTSARRMSVTFLSFRGILSLCVF